MEGKNEGSKEIRTAKEKRKGQDGFAKLFRSA